MPGNLFEIGAFSSPKQPQFPFTLILNSLAKRPASSSRERSLSLEKNSFFSERCSLLSFSLERLLTPSKRPLSPSKRPLSKRPVSVELRLSKRPLSLSLSQPPLSPNDLSLSRTGFLSVCLCLCLSSNDLSLKTILSYQTILCSSVRP